jgi:hypothetical protein
MHTLCMCTHTHTHTHTIYPTLVHTFYQEDLSLLWRMQQFFFDPSKNSGFPSLERERPHPMYNDSRVSRYPYLCPPSQLLGSLASDDNKSCRTGDHIWWCSPVIPATGEVVIGGSLSKAGSGKSVRPYVKNEKQKG